MDRWNLLNKFLIQESTGLVQPLTVRRSLNTCLIQELELSPSKSVEAVFDSGVTALDIETTNNRYLLSGAADGSIAIHDLHFLRNNQLNGGIPGSGIYKAVGSVLSRGNSEAHIRNIRTVQWCPWDETKFTSSALDKTFKIWDANLLTVTQMIACGSPVHCHQMSFFSACHNMMCVATDSCCPRLMDIRKGSTIIRFRGHRKGAVTVIQWSNRDEYLLATGGYDQFVHLWDIRASKPLLTLHRDGEPTHNGRLCGVAFTVDGFHLVSYATDQRFFLWDVLTGQQIMKDYPLLNHTQSPSARLSLTTQASQNFAFVPAGSYILTFSVMSPGRSRRLYGHSRRINCCVFHNSENQLFSGGNDCKILVYTAAGLQSESPEDDSEE